MLALAPNIDLAFAEAGPDPADRVRAVAAAGFDRVALFRTSDKDVAALRRALDDAGVGVASSVAEPFCDFTFPGADLTRFLDGLRRSIDDAVVLGSPLLVVTTGVGFPGADRDANLERVTAAMARAVEAARGSGVRLLVEAVNTRIDHPGSILDSTVDAVRIARAVGDPEAFGIDYDFYHSTVNGEDPATELARAGAYLGQVDVADVPGRGAPGTGRIDWPAFLRVLTDSGYHGPVVIEVAERGPDSAAALRSFRDLVAAAG